MAGGSSMSILLTRSSGSARKETPKAENDGSLVLPHYLQRETKARLEGKAKDWQKKPQQSVWEDLCSGKALQREGFSRLRAAGVSCHQVPLPQRRAWPKTAAWLMHKQWRSSLRFGRSRQPVLELPRISQDEASTLLPSRLAELEHPELKFSIS